MLKWSDWGIGSGLGRARAERSGGQPMATTSLRSGGKVVSLGTLASWHESSHTDNWSSNRRSVKLRIEAIWATVELSSSHSNLTVSMMYMDKCVSGLSRPP